MGLLDEAIREHLELKRRRGADAAEVSIQEQEALGPARRGPEPLEAPQEPALAGAYPDPGPAALEDAELEMAPGVDAHPPVDHEPSASYPSGEALQAERTQDQAVADAVDLAQPEPGHADPAQPEVGYPEPEYAEPDYAEPANPQPAYAEPANPQPAYAEPAPVDPPLVGQETMAFDVASELAQESPTAPEHGDPSQTPVPPPNPAPGPSGPQDPAEAPDTEAGEAPPHPDDVLEETPEFLQETPEHDRLWFEQRPPRDFDFDK